MPVVLREGGWSFGIYSNDHPPPHVHARCAEHRLKIVLGLPGELPHAGFLRSTPDHVVWDALDLVAQHEDLLRESWRKIHG